MGKGETSIILLTIKKFLKKNENLKLPEKNGWYLKVSFKRWGEEWKKTIPGQGNKFNAVKSLSNTHTHKKNI